MPEQGIIIIDAKASMFKISKRKAKRRLMEAGLAPSEAGRIVKLASTSWYPATSLRNTMRHHKRHGAKWFPWDSVIMNEQRQLVHPRTRG